MEQLPLTFDQHIGKMVTSPNISWPIVLILLIAHWTSMGCLDITQCSKRGPLKRTTLECYLPEQAAVDPSDEMHNSDNVSWTLEQEAGVMLVQFHLMRGINKYELALLQTSSPPPGEEICPDQYETHSKITYELGSKSDNITMCGKIGEVTFQYVSSGCYTLEVTKHGYDGGYPRIHTFCPLTDCIKTNYIVKYIDTETTYNIAIRQGSRLEITFTHNDSIHWLREYVLTKNDTLEKIEWEVQVDKLSEKLSCEYGNAAHPTRCWMEDNVQFCEISNMKVGYYTGEVSYEDDARCRANTVWTTHSDSSLCREHFNHTIEIPPWSASKNETTVKASSNIYLILGISLGSVIFVIGIIFFFILTKRTDIPRGPGRPFEVPTVDLIEFDPTKVFLLYSRDCPEFMKVMSSLNQFLEKYNIKVFDYFENEMAENVSTDPMVWVRNLIDDPDVRIMLVSSECASVIYQSRQRGKKINYKSPRQFDHVFSYALKVIEDIHYNDLYTRIYHVKIENFTEKQHILPHNTPNRIFTLPNDLGELINHLKKEYVGWKFLKNQRQRGNGNIHVATLPE